MYYLLGISLALALLLTINALASLLGAAIWRCARGPARRWSARARARFLFTLRTFPPVASFICVITLLLPAYLAYEPQHSEERVGVKLAALAFVSAFGCLLAIWRGISSWRATRRLVRDWLYHARPARVEGINIPVYRVQHSFPVIAIVGAFRPRLFIASHLFERLTPEELLSAVKHERGHLASRDNLRRPLVRACCDVLSIVPCGRALDRAWKEESEAAADEYAARVGGSTGALALASALVKIARMIPQGSRPTMPAGAFLVNENEAEIVSRVGRLVSLSSSGPRERARTFITGFGSLILYGSLLAGVAVLVSQTQFLRELHGVIEHLVSALA